MAGSEGQPLLVVRELRKVYRRRGQQPITAVDGVSFSVPRSHTTALIGESGSGKSTIGRLVLAVTPADGGDVILEGRRLSDLDRKGLQLYRRSVQMVFQDPLSAFNPMLTIGASLRDAMKLLEIDRSERASRAIELLHRVHLAESVLRRYPAEVSGGQLQRVGIARALATEPSLVFLDEPTSALDVSIRGQVLELLGELQADTGVAYLLVSHDMRVVSAMAHEIVVMYVGQVVEHGPAAQVAQRPMHPYTKALVAAASRDPHARTLKLRGEATHTEWGDAGCRLRARCPFHQDGCELPQQLVPLEEGHSVRCWRARDIGAEAVGADAQPPVIGESAT